MKTQDALIDIVHRIYANYVEDLKHLDINITPVKTGIRILIDGNSSFMTIPADVAIALPNIDLVFKLIVTMVTVYRVSYTNGQDQGKKEFQQNLKSLLGLEEA